MDVAARVNHGRWIADCPDCPSAYLLPRSNDELRCVECGSGPHSVVMPEEREVIDVTLSRRDPLNRNWQPGETVEDLQAENDEHGVG